MRGHVRLKRAGICNNDEARMSNDEGDPNDEARTGVGLRSVSRHSKLHHSFFIRHSDFGIDNGLQFHSVLALA
jgi:hypothetical protein